MTTQSQTGKKAVVYKHTVKPEKEKDFLGAYEQITTHFLKNGARNFAINKNADGDFLIYSIWENSANPHWSENDNLPDNVKKAIKTLKSCYTSNSRKDRSKEMQLIKKLYIPNTKSTGGTKKSVIYKHTVKPEKEQEFLKLYEQIANHFLKDGARNFAINKNADGDFLIYSIWEGQATPDWNENDNLPDDIKKSIKMLKECYTSDSRKDRSKVMTMLKKHYLA